MWYHGSGGEAGDGGVVYLGDKEAKRRGEAEEHF